MFRSTLSMIQMCLIIYALINLCSKFLLLGSHNKLFIKVEIYTVQIKQFFIIHKNNVQDHHDELAQTHLLISRYIHIKHNQHAISVIALTRIDFLIVFIYITKLFILTR